MNQRTSSPTTLCVLAELPRPAIASLPLGAQRVARYVEHVRAIAPTHGPARVDRVPDGRTCLVFRELERGHGDLTVMGPFTRAHFKDSAHRAVVLQFRPGWSAPFLARAASELTNTLVHVDELWGSEGRALLDELLRASTTEQKVASLARALTTRLAQAWEPTSAPLARRAASMLATDGARIEHVAARLGVTSRHLRRAFHDNIGVTPKEFARAARLQRALALAPTSDGWLRVAHAAGYYDHAHLVAEFHDLLGMTPTAFARRMRGEPAREASTLGEA